MEIILSTGMPAKKFQNNPANTKQTHNDCHNFDNDPEGFFLHSSVAELPCGTLLMVCIRVSMSARGS